MHRYVACLLLLSFVLTTCPAPATGRVTLLWHAPFLTGSGYGQEAIEYMMGLLPLIKKRSRDLSAKTANDPGPVGGDFIDETARDADGNIAPRRRSKNIVSNLMALQHADLPNFDAPAGWSPAVSEVMDSVLLLRGSPPAASVSVCHSEPGAWSLPTPLYQTTQCPLMAAHSSVQIGRTMFETDRIPKGWEERLNKMTEVWVPSEFNKKTFIEGGVDKERVFVVPEAIDTSQWSRDRILREYKQQGNKAATSGTVDDGAVNLFDLYPSSSWINKKCDIKFLSVFKWEELKGWDVLLSAFFEEFVEGELAHRKKTGQSASESWKNPKHRDARTCLVVKASGYHSDIEDGDDEEYGDQILNYIRKKYKKYASRMYIFSAHLPSEEFPLLYTGVDAVVQPSRGEGWGRPHSEAMSMGTPVIATNWSGSTEFMKHEENSLLISIEEHLTEIKTGAFKGHKWAEPRKDELRKLMRRVADAVTVERGLSKLIPFLEKPVEDIEKEDIPVLQHIRSQGRHDMVSKYDSHVVAKIILKRIDNCLREKFYVQRVEEAEHVAPPQEPDHAYDL